MQFWESSSKEFEREKKYRMRRKSERKVILSNANSVVYKIFENWKTVNESYAGNLVELLCFLNTCC